MGNLTDFIKTAEEMLDCHNKENPLLGIMAAIALLKECARKDYEGMREFQAKFIEADQERIRLTSHLASARAGGWLPISTAPKDGTRILVYEAQYTEMGYWDRDDEEEGGQCWRRIDMDNEAIQPTHWMPLPSSPDALATAQEGNETELTHQPNCACAICSARCRVEE